MSLSNLHCDFHANMHSYDMLIELFINIYRHWAGGEGRTPTSVLTCLLKNYHPGLVEYKGKIVVASTWKHYEASKDSSGISAADSVCKGFWVNSAT